MGPASDTWALGIILFELLADRHPYCTRDDSFEEVRDRALHSRIVPVDSIATDVPHMITELCSAMLERDPKRRPGLGVVEREISSFQRGVGVDPSSAEEVRKPETGPNSWSGVEVPVTVGMPPAAATNHQLAEIDIKISVSVRRFDGDIAR